jgi:hypothetical protein
MAPHQSHCTLYLSLLYGYSKSHTAISCSNTRVAMPAAQPSIDRMRCTYTSSDDRIDGFIVTRRPDALSDSDTICRSRNLTCLETHLHCLQRHVRPTDSAVLHQPSWHTVYYCIPNKAPIYDITASTNYARAAVLRACAARCAVLCCVQLRCTQRTQCMPPGKLHVQYRDVRHYTSLF